MVRQLLDAGAELSEKEIFEAVKAGSRGTVDVLLNHGAAVEGVPGRPTSLLEAAVVGMQWLMERHNVPCDQGVLCAAVCSGLEFDEENMRYLQALLDRVERPQRGMAGVHLEVTVMGYASFHARM